MTNTIHSKPLDPKCKKIKLHYFKVVKSSNKLPFNIWFFVAHSQNFFKKISNTYPKKKKKNSSLRLINPIKILTLLNWGHNNENVYIAWSCKISSKTLF
jgi:hypothetical protein